MHQEELIGKTIGHYRLQHLAGVGGMATVFLAEDTHLARQVAVKVFQQDAEQDAHQEFLREARIVAQLDHPHILRVYDYGEEGGLAYLVMPFMAQGSLQDLLIKQRVIPVRTALPLLIQVLQGLAYAHERGLVHRDIKPGNMLFKTDLSLVLSDFGIAKVVAQPISNQHLFLTSATATNRLIGTPAYMAPEQAERRATTQSDIYSMGVVLYEVITGKRPFQDKHPIALLMKHMREMPQPPRLLNQHISADLEQVILMALAKDPTQRFPNAQAFAQALTRVLEQEPELSAAQTQIGSRDTDTDIPATQIAGEIRNVSGMDEIDRTTLPTHTEIATLPNTMPVFPPAAITHYPRRVQTKRRRITHRFIPILLVLILLTTPGIYLFATGRLALSSSSTHNPASTKRPLTAPIITPTLADCPTSGHARSGSLPDMTTGSAPALVYIAMAGSSTAPTMSKLEFLNINTRKTTLIATFLNTLLSQVLLSPNGKWLLFSLRVQHRQKLELMRIDGQDLQTLYCSTQNQLDKLSWSPDQKRVVFQDENAQTQKGTLSLLTLSSGALQPISTTSRLLPFSWADATHLYFVYSSDPFSEPILFLANMSQYQPGAKVNMPDGSSSFPFHFASQQMGLTFQLGNVNSGGCSQFAGGKEAYQIFVLACTANGGPSYGIVLETYQSPDTYPILTPIVADVNVVHFWVISNDILLMDVENAEENGGASSTNGLWKVDIRTQTPSNYSEQQLSKVSLDRQAIMPPDQSIASRDGTLYALPERGANQESASQLLVGSVSGGTPMPVVSVSGATTLAMVGWATI